MLRLQGFDVERPGSVDEAVALLDRHGAKCKLLAGGTDVMPNLKHGLYEPEVVIALSAIDELRGVRLAGSLLEIGALTTLEELEAHPLVVARAPGLAQAARAVAGPTQRTMGTIGGNVCLDTRCVWINQTHFWRKSLGFCLKKDGTVCHVVKGGKSCVAAASNDTATMLVALDARLTIRSAAGAREVPIREFYKSDGAYNLKLAPNELLTRITVAPARLAAGERHHSGYAKLRPRATIDFPKLSVAATFTTGGDGAMSDATVVVSAIAAVPRLMKGVAELARGRKPGDPDALAAIGAFVQRSTHPLTNLDGDVEYRRAMVPVFVKRAFLAAKPAQDGASAAP